MPLRHIGIIVIWEGNYNPDILFIGRDPPNHELNFQGFFSYEVRVINRDLAYNTRNPKDVKRGCFTELENYGRSSVAKRMDCVARGMDCVANRIDCGSMKVFPTTAEFDEKEEKPSLTYRIMTENTDDYTIEIWTTPANSVQNKRPLRFMLTAAKNKTQIITAVSAEVKAGNPDDEDWRRGVLDNIRVSKANLSLEKGIQEITISALEAGLILERILIYRKEDSLLKSYLGPRESFFVK